MDTHESGRSTDVLSLPKHPSVSYKEIVKGSKYSLVKQTAMGGVFYGFIDFSAFLLTSSQTF